jgi:hypothetical protein
LYERQLAAASGSERQRAAASGSERQRAAASGSEAAYLSGGSLATYHADLWGTQDEKYFWCRKSTFDDVAWVEVEAKKPNYLFVPQDGETRDEYECGVKVTEVLPVNSVGIVTARDALTIHETPEEVWKVVQDFSNLPTEKAREKYSLGNDARDWQVSLAQADLKNSGPNKKNILPVLYRPFDVRSIYYTTTSRGFICMPRPEGMRHMIVGENLALLYTRPLSPAYEFGALMTNTLIDQCVAGNKSAGAGISYLAPLYLYNPPNNGDTQLLGTGKDGRRANLSPAFIAQLGTLLKLRWQSDGAGDGKSTFGPEDVLAYIYAIFHAPSYRARYAEFLKIDFPRVPLTNDAKLFWELVREGNSLIQLHLLRLGNWDEVMDDHHTPRGEIAAGYPKYESGKVVINKAGEGFDGVEEAVWNFHIGGYQVAHKWLKDRKGRVLSPEDATHYRKTLTALEFTIEHMRNIDRLIEEHDGWPLVGSQDKSTFGEDEVKSFFAQRDAS